MCAVKLKYGNAFCFITLSVTKENVYGNLNDWEACDLLSAEFSHSL